VKTEKTRMMPFLAVVVVAMGIAVLLGLTVRPSVGSEPDSRVALTNLIDKHEKKGIQCSACHKTQSVRRGAHKETCIGCHGSYEILSKKSRIHETMLSPHFEGGTDCGLCHNIHKPSRLLCGQCHDIDTKVP